MAQSVSQIQKKISSIARKDAASVVLSINAFHPEEQSDLLKRLSHIEQHSADAEREGKEKKRDRAEEEGRFIGRLKEKINSIKNEKVQVKTRFFNCRELLHMKVTDRPEVELLDIFTKLDTFLVDINVLQCMAHYKQGEVVANLKKLGHTLAGVAKMIGHSSSFVERLHAFFKFAEEFPLLIICGYSFETVLKFKSAIKKQAETDDDFCSRLQIHVTIEFEGENDDELMDDAEREMSKVSTH